MSEVIAIDEKTSAKPKSVLLDMAARFQMEPKAFESTVKQTVMPQKGQNVSNEEFAAFLMVAREYNLNPIVKEIYAFPSRAGGIQPIVSIDGWCRIINEHPQFNGMEFRDHKTDGVLTAIECRIYRKDREHPICATEYLEECKQNTEPWKKWPSRMLRHKALIQCARYAFGFSGIVDPDEAERMREVSPNNNQHIKEAALKEQPQTIEHEPNKLDDLLEPAEESDA